MSFNRISPKCLLFYLLIVGASAAQDEDFDIDPVEPSVAAASPEGEQALRSFQLSEGLEATLYAAEPMVANPVAFFMDSQGRTYVCESFRQGQGVTDNRKHDQQWLEADLAAQSVNDRLRFHKRLLGEDAVEYARNDDRIRLLTDTDGDGRADRAQVFANRFNKVVDGTGAGVLARDGTVFYTCIPHLWKLTDTDADGMADDRSSLHSGYGVRVAFRGHDMHGLIIGPDGKLYYSIGDRGYNVKTASGHFHDPASGAVFRCNLDGTELEVFATGLRNPQELAFDDYGNLFTGDNNSDSGDEARWVYVVEGGDSGWRMYYQYLADRGPFNRERLWHPPHDDQPAYIVPPVANVADGPSGLIFYPGTGLSNEFKGRFLLCDFRGTAVRSGVRSFRVKPKGAFFELVDQQQPIWNILATDIQMGPDGGLYVSDWVDGWVGEGKGRIYRFSDPTHVQSAIVREVKSLLGGALKKQSDDQLLELLAHEDQRVRQEAQFALVDRGASGLLIRAASRGKLVSRLHALWGVGQLVRQQAVSAAPVAKLLRDGDGEVRAQAAKVIADLRRVPAGTEAELIRLLEDEYPRARYFAALALGKLHADAAAIPVARMLAAADDDPILRHGAIMAFAGLRTEALEALFSDSSQAVRLAIVVALRKKNDPAIVHFLSDPHPAVVVEAVRAIHDLPLDDLLPDVAALIKAPATDEAAIDNAAIDDAIVRRALNANYRLGKPQHAAVVAAFAARPDAGEDMRLEAIKMLADWASPAGRDRVLGAWRPLPPRSAEIARNAVDDHFEAMTEQPGPVQVAAAAAAARLGVKSAAVVLRRLMQEADQDGVTRADALNSLAQLGDTQLEDVTRQALSDSSPLVRDQARRILVKLDRTAALESLRLAINSENTIERQGALKTLAKTEGAVVDDILVHAVSRLLQGQIPADTELDVISAAQQRKQPQLRSLLKQFDQQRKQDDPLADYRETLFGGDPQAGRKIFFERTQVSCVRCHRAEGTGGDVGPNLGLSVPVWNKKTEIQKREHLLESLVAPSRYIVPAFQSVIIVTDRGRVLSGVKKSENENSVSIVTNQAQIINIAKAEIDELQVSKKSGMPDDLWQYLSKLELRDLVAYLSSLEADEIEQRTEE